MAGLLAVIICWSRPLRRVLLLPAQAAPPAIGLSPSSGPPTTHVVVAGGFWTAGETIKVFFDTIQVASKKANSSGELLTSFTVPASLASWK